LISVGIVTNIYSYSLEECVKRIKADGFTCAALEIDFTDMDNNIDTLDKKKCKKIRDAFRDENLLIAVISADGNLVHADPDKRKKNIERVKTLIKFSHDLGCSYVVSESGTFNPTRNWIYHPKNDTEEAYEETLKTIIDIVKYAYDYGAVFLIEVYINSVINSVESVQRLFADVNHKSLGLLMDPANYFNLCNLDRMDSELDRMFDALGDKVKVAHAKDIKKADDMTAKHDEINLKNSRNIERTFINSGGVELNGPGLGVLNYNKFLNRLYRIDPNIPLIVEHLDFDDIKRAKKFVDEKLKEIGC